MEFRKNDLVTLEIEDCGIDGEGIGKADGFTVFVKDAVIGDTVTAKIIKAKKNYGYGRLMEVLKPSPYRVEPKCEFARQCGGCQLQALSYDQQLVFKTNKVKGHLERIGGFTDIPMEPIIGMDELFHYRNKAQFPVGRNKEGKIVTGFYAGRTHNIIENRDCALGVAENKEVLDRVIAHMEKYGIEPYNEATGKGLVRHVLIRYGYFTKEVMVCDSWRRDLSALGPGIYHRQDRRYFLSDFSSVFLSGKSYADPEALCKGTGIRRSSWGRDSMGSLLWDRNNFPVPGTESKICPRCGNCSGSYRECERKCET